MWNLSPLLSPASQCSKRTPRCFLSTFPPCPGMSPFADPFLLCDCPRIGTPFMQPKPKHAITIAVSSRALFNMVDGRKIFEEEGLEKYMEYQLTNENVILTPGPAFRFVKVLSKAVLLLSEPWMEMEGPRQVLGNSSRFLYNYWSTFVILALFKLTSGQLMLSQRLLDW